MSNVLHIVVGYRLAQDFLVSLVLVQHWVSWLGPYWLLHWLDLGQVGSFAVGKLCHLRVYRPVFELAHSQL